MTQHSYGSLGKNFKPHCHGLVEVALVKSCLDSIHPLYYGAHYRHVACSSWREPRTLAIDDKRHSPLV
jgi:hypothetical protein